MRTRVSANWCRSRPRTFLRIGSGSDSTIWSNSASEIFSSPIEITIVSGGITGAGGEAGFRTSSLTSGFGGGAAGCCATRHAADENIRILRKYIPPSYQPGFTKPQTKAMPRCRYGELFPPSSHAPLLMEEDGNSQPASDRFRTRRIDQRGCNGNRAKRSSRCGMDASPRPLACSDLWRS